VLAAPWAELPELDAVRSVPPALVRLVVPTLAFLASHRHCNALAWWHRFDSSAGTGSGRVPHAHGPAAPRRGPVTAPRRSREGLAEGAAGPAEAGGRGLRGGGLAEGGADPRPPLRLQIETTDYDEETLGEAARAYAAAAEPAAGAGGGVAEDAAADAPAALEARFAGARRTDRAVACLERAFPGYPGELVEVKRAEFEGTPAFIGYVLEGAGGDDPPVTLSIWVADAGDCSILSLISARL